MKTRLNFPIYLDWFREMLHAIIFIVLIFLLMFVTFMGRQTFKV